MIRGYAYISEKDFQEIYCCLSFFTKIYDNGEEYIPLVLDSIVDAYIETMESKHQYISREEARKTLSTLPRNVRDAGRKPRYKDKDLLTMVEMHDSGESFSDIASRFKCSETYVRKVVKNHKSS